MTKWISVEDRLPPKGKVLLYFPAITNAEHSSNNHSEWITIDFGGFMHRKPTHWMPLPAPPEQGNA